MSADNGTILRKTTTGFYEVSYFQGDSQTVKDTFADADDALDYIAENLNDTEYGITLVDFGDTKEKQDE